MRCTEINVFFLSGALRSKEKSLSGSDATNADGEEQEGDVPIIQRVTEGRKAVKKAEAEYESDVSREVHVWSRLILFTATEGRASDASVRTGSCLMSRSWVLNVDGLIAKP